MMNESFFPFLWQAGGEIFTEDGSSTAFNSPAGAEAAIFLRELLDVGAMPGYSSGLDGDDTEAMFLEGRAAFAPGRSEERRVGKECRYRGWPSQQKKKKVYVMKSIREYM